MQVRLNKLIAEAGLASRRGADRLIEEGQVTVNGKKVYELGVKVDPHQDQILIDGKPLRKAAQKIYLIFNKPKGVITSMEDPMGRPTVADYMEKVPYRVFPVGRLDWDSEGLLLLTNDGELANKIMHPKEEITKTYLVKLDGQPKPEQIAKLLRGVSIIGGKVAAKHVEKIKRHEGSEKYDWYKIVITEGKNRQIRQMFEKIGYDVQKLQRVAIGCLRIGNLERGEVVFLHESALPSIFKPDLPDEVKAKKTYKGSTASTKREVASFPAKKAKNLATEKSEKAQPVTKASAKPASAKASSATAQLGANVATKLAAKKKPSSVKKTYSRAEISKKDFFDNLELESESKTTKTAKKSRKK